MNRRTSGASLLYAGSPARWFRTAAMIADAWGSSLCALQWHASRVAQDRAAKAQPVMGVSLMGPHVMDLIGHSGMGLMGQRAPVRVRRDRE